MKIIHFCYEHLIKSFLFQMDPERAHDLTFATLKKIAASPMLQSVMTSMFHGTVNPSLKQQLFGLDFDHPIGLAAGLDKNATAVPVWGALGFAFLEVGTVTPLAQPGNDQPRLFRLPVDQALINRMGFNNGGSEAMAKRLRAFGTSRVPLAVNIGKNKATPNEEALRDYTSCMHVLYDCGDFFVVNISSPNTPNLRELQKSEELDGLLKGIFSERETLAAKHGGKLKPVLVKLSPDMSQSDLEVTVHTMKQHPVDGIIATNTTLSRDGLQDSNRGETGGLSGLPLTVKSTEVIRSIYRLSGKNIPIVGVGGIFNADDAYNKIKAGSSLVEIYTSLIYKGPGLVGEIRDGLAERLRRDGFTHISQAVGVEG